MVGARVSTNRPWRKRRQLDPRCGVYLPVAAGRFLREMHGEPVAILLAVLAGGESSESSDFVLPCGVPHVVEQFLCQCIRSSVSLAHLRMCKFGVLKFGSCGGRQRAEGGSSLGL